MVMGSPDFYKAEVALYQHDISPTIGEWLQQG